MHHRDVAALAGGLRQQGRCEVPCPLGRPHAAVPLWSGSPPQGRIGSRRRSAGRVPSHSRHVRRRRILGGNTPRSRCGYVPCPSSRAPRLRCCRRVRRPFRVGRRRHVRTPAELHDRRGGRRGDRVQEQTGQTPLFSGTSEEAIDYVERRQATGKNFVAPGAIIAVGVVLVLVGLFVRRRMPD
jgi:hypothetical protein